MKASSVALIGFSVLLLCACGPKQLPKAELLQWMEDEDNNLRQTKTEADVTYILQYKTMDYVLAGKGNAALGDEDPQRLRADTEKSLLFDLYMTCENGKSSPLQYRAVSADEVNARYYYYHFRFADDIYLEVNNQKIKPLYCIADKGSGLNNALAFSIGFEREAVGDNDFRFTVNDTRLGSGTVKFLYKQTYIRHIPQLTD